MFHQSLSISNFYWYNITSDEQHYHCFVKIIDFVYMCFKKDATWFLCVCGRLYIVLRISTVPYFCFIWNVTVVPLLIVQWWTSIILRWVNSCGSVILFLRYVVCVLFWLRVCVSDSVCVCFCFYFFR